MSELSLFPFQARAANQIVKRFHELEADTNRPWELKRWKTPFYQALSALTGAGKTPILADAVSQLRASLETEPIVLWVSKAKAVVEQTLANFESGGKYSHFLEGFIVTPLSELQPDAIRDTSAPTVALATVGAFNQRGKEDGTLRVHQTGHDKADDSLWNLLRNRPADDEDRRRLIVVYDEGHNLSDQQTDLLLELEPDVILVASATMRTSGRLAKLLQRLKDAGWNDDRLVTSVNSKDVVKAGLVKRQIILGGYATIMETAIDDLIRSMSEANRKTERLQAGFKPKAIYVCRTNISQDDGTRDNAAKPFSERKAPPILIWRYLVEKKRVNPKEIAVYCDLKMDRHNPPPKDFVLFSGGEEDFAAFTRGNYRHIIFNQSLQEGWDDPECCFAYIDKSMGSSIQVEQVIGRVLRQPGARHYSDPDLNTANFYIRVDSKQVFPEILETVRRKIAAELPEVKLEGYSDRRTRDRVRGEPKESLVIPEIHIDTDIDPLTDAVKQIIDFRKDEGGNTVGKGEKVRVVQSIGTGRGARTTTRQTEHSNRVMARWILRRTIQSSYPRAALAIDWSDPRFDARVEITSPAANALRESAENLVHLYLEHSDLVFEDENPYTVGPVLTNPNKFVPYKNALHEGYSDLNGTEQEYAVAIDSLGLRWVRNPSSGGYSIPLLNAGDTFNFFPDFLIWKDRIVFALDPKGDHLIDKDAGRKLLNIRDEKGRQKVVVRLFTQGKWIDSKTKKSPAGITVWKIGSAGVPRPTHHPTIVKAVESALKL